MNEHLRADARSEALREAVCIAAANLPPMHVQAAERKALLKDAAHRSLVVCIADAHYDAEWQITGLLGEIVNKYGPKIFEKRMARLYAELETIIIREGILQVTLLLCGDSLDGMLRNTQLMKLRYGAVESCMRYAEYMTQWIAKLAERCVVMVYSIEKVALGAGACDAVLRHPSCFYLPALICAGPSGPAPLRGNRRFYLLT